MPISTDLKTVKAEIIYVGPETLNRPPAAFNRTARFKVDPPVLDREGINSRVLDRPTYKRNYKISFSLFCRKLSFTSIKMSVLSVKNEIHLRTFEYVIGFI